LSSLPSKRKINQEDLSQEEKEYNKSELHDSKKSDPITYLSK
jgi:hypothetical protein